MKRKKFDSLVDPLHVELNKLARWLQHTGKRLVVLFEGRDTAGKGGVITTIAERLNSRQVRIVALAKPSDRERSQWYFQRYIAHLPAAGEIVLFDRSWYNRAGVEKVMGFCSDDEYERFLEQVPEFERMLVDDGAILLKYWLSVDQREQEERFKERAEDPLKRWKLSPVDLEARQKYGDYGRARDKMFRVTHTKRAPWFVVNFNDQRKGRLNLISHLLEQIDYKDVPSKPIPMPPLKGPLRRERFKGPVRPIRARY